MDELEPLAEPLPAAPELEPAPAEFELELPEDPMEPEVEPAPAVPLRLLCWSALEPAPALSRLHAAMPKASAAAVIAAVRVFIIAVIS